MPHCSPCCCDDSRRCGCLLANAAQINFMGLRQWRSPVGGVTWPDDLLKDRTYPPRCCGHGCSEACRVDKVDTLGRMKMEGAAMKHQVAVWTLLSMLFFAPVLASNVAGPGSLECGDDPVVELHGQDTAFSLLLECYQQIQASLIQTDYDSRLIAASRLVDSRARGAITVLADMERYLRQQKLGKQIQRLLTT